MKLKTIIFLLAWLMPFFVQAQIQSGEIIYKVKNTQDDSTMDSLKVTNPSVYNYFSEKDRKIKTVLPYLDFKLTFNQQESTFSLVEKMETDLNNSIEAATRYVRAAGVYYTNIDEALQLRQFELLGDKWLIESKLDTIDWKIQKEIKTIHGYQARKATATIPLNHIVQGEVTAWFTPDIPFQFGPIGVGKLPGLILEYHINDVVFYTDKISLLKKPLKIQRPTKGERATKTEMMRKAKERFFGG